MTDNYKKERVVIIPYKALEMIQVANGEEVAFYAIFKCIDKMKQKTVAKIHGKYSYYLEYFLYKKDHIPIIFWFLIKNTGY